MSTRFRHAPVEPRFALGISDDIRLLAQDVAVLAAEVAYAALSDKDYQPLVADLQGKIRRLAFGSGEVIGSLVERLEYRDKAAERNTERLVTQRDTLLASVVAEAIGDHFKPHGYFVYILWGSDPITPLYVGQSSNILNRLGSHMADRNKRARTQQIQLIRCKTKRHMDETEMSLIRRYRPPLNTAGIPIDDTPAVRPLV